MGSSPSTNIEDYKPKKGWGSSIDSLIDESWEMMKIRWSLNDYAPDSHEFVARLCEWATRYDVSIEKYNNEVDLLNLSDVQHSVRENVRDVLNKCIMMMVVISNNKDDYYCVWRLNDQQYNHYSHSTIIRMYSLLVKTHFIHTCSIPDLRKFIAICGDRIEEQKQRYLGRLNNSTSVETYEVNMNFLRHILANREADASNLERIASASLDVKIPPPNASVDV